MVEVGGDGGDDGDAARIEQVLDRLRVHRDDVPDEPEVLLARAQGQNVVAIAGIVQRPLTSVMSLPKAGIAKPADLANKTVGTAGIPYQKAYLDTIAKSAGISPSSIKQVDVGFNLNQALVSGKVDATLGGFWNVEGVELQQKDRDPRITPVDDLGVPDYAELVLVAGPEGLAVRDVELVPAEEPAR